MKLTQALQYALTYLGDEDAEITASAVRRGDRKLQQLVRCANMTIKEIAAEYLPLVARQTVTCKNNAFGYDALEKRVYRIVRVLDGKDGARVAFRMYPDRCELAAPCEIAHVAYEYVPSDIGANDECETLGCVSAKTLGLGIAAEYAMLQGLYEQSVMLSERFESDMRAACRMRGEHKWKARRWA